ncbi:MAG: heme exporter protein CcmD [Alphaproteobacteria bacterium]|nr:heme exporter protein CcmD [Alphaproteobacteria bacterium]
MDKYALYIAVSWGLTAVVLLGVTVQTWLAYRCAACVLEAKE